jgi:hypothetical protein
MWSAGWSSGNQGEKWGPVSLWVAALVLYLAFNLLKIQRPHIYAH